MELTEFLRYMDSGQEVIAGSEIHLYMCALSQEAIRLTTELNNSYHTGNEVVSLMRQITGRQVDDSFSLFPPFYTDCGKNLKIGKNVFFNSGVKIQDQGGVTIEDGALIGHNVVIATLDHSLDPRHRGNLRPAPIHIGKNVWVGANTTICKGVTIGEGAGFPAPSLVSYQHFTDHAGTVSSSVWYLRLQHSTASISAPYHGSDNRQSAHNWMHGYL